MYIYILYDIYLARLKASQTLTVMDSVVLARLVSRHESTQCCLFKIVVFGFVGFLLFT